MAEVIRAVTASICAAGLSLGVWGCEAAHAPVEPTLSRAAIVYGEDDRRELFELGASELRTTLESSVAAIVPKQVVQSSANGVSFQAPTFARSHNLCAGERFGEQPAAAMCSGVLVDHDLVLTAGHCLRVLALPDLRFVFGYYYTAPGQLAVRPEDVIEPSAIVAEALSWPADPEQLDFAFVRLRHAVEAPRAPAPIRTAITAASEGEPLTNVGTSGGLPMKVDPGATIVHARAEFGDYFLADADTSHGASGCGGFSPDGSLIGVLSRGGPDDAVGPDGCKTTNMEPLRSNAREEFGYASTALARLCAKDPAASSLCRADCGQPCRALPVVATSDGCSVGRAAGASGRTLRSIVLVVIGLCLIWRRSRRVRLFSPYRRLNLSWVVSL